MFMVFIYVTKDKFAYFSDRMKITARSFGTVKFISGKCYLYSYITFHAYEGVLSVM